jgi:hypothetical protein
MGDRGLLLAWAHGWSLSRNRPTPVPVHGGVRIDAEHSGPPRYVLPVLDALPPACQDPGKATSGTEVKTLANRAQLRNWTGDGWSMYPACELMVTEFAAGPVGLPASYTAQVAYAAATITAAILDRHGTPVSSAHLARWGEYGIVDQVETHTGHQRRGLATAIMTILGNQAVDSGARSGLLCATEQGAALYRRLGWTGHGTVTGTVRLH